jgi:DNA replication protein DnaC
MKAYEKTIFLLRTLKLKGIEIGLDELIHEAETGPQSHITFLNAILNAEIDYRVAKRLKRNLVGAHFPVEKKIDDYEFSQVKGITKSETVNLLDCRWIDNRENLLFFGPPGLGKTHLAIGIGYQAIEKGYTVCFERITSLIKLLKTAEVQKSAEHRIRRILKANALIIDEIGYTPIEKREANLFFNLISELYEKSSIIITSNKSFESWAEMMGDTVMTTALLDRLFHHARIFNLQGDSYRLKNMDKEEDQNSGK